MASAWFGLFVPAGTPAAGVERIHQARSLRDLWHLRADVFRLIAIHHNQQEAEARLLALNRHFPTRTPRTSAAGAPT